MTGTLHYDDVLAIHERVCRDFAFGDDPVGGGGVRDEGRHLAAVVARQETGIGSTMKYPDPLSNAASLMFGLCCGHPFHNGNKRTALVALLAHLDRNGYTVFGVRQRDLYLMTKAVAEHELGVRPGKRKKSRDYSSREADDEVKAITAWLERHARKLRRGEHLITYKQLRKLLAHHGIEMANPRNNSIGLYRDVEVKRGLLRNKTRTERKHMGTIGYPGDNKILGMKTIKQVRRITHLDEAHGCDTDAFYHGADLIDVFVNEYRGILARLARE